MAAPTILIFSLLAGLAAAWMDERPVLESKDGNLYICSAKDRNITLKTLGGGSLNVNGINLLHVAEKAHNATQLIDRWRTGHLAEIETNLQRLADMVDGPVGLQRRVSTLEEFGIQGNDARPTNRSRAPSTLSDSALRTGLRRVAERVRRLEERVRNVLTKLREDNCASNPCQNGATCEDRFDNYACHCTSGWEGPNCLTDVNECARLLGTDLGCQNGATCVNLLGSYKCMCQPGWFGVHCTQKTSICSVQNSEELCGHGVCVSKPSAPGGYTCICDQGWEPDGTNPACTKDVNECEGRHPACSVSPPVPCVNAPGTFYCGSCPPGYTGNGYYCADIDECLTDNGGCSTTPKVQCINTMGSRICGQCPQGYEGNGVTCTFVGFCRMNNGGCHYLATCTENLALVGSYVQCRCPPGYYGNGLGPNGCVLSTNAIAQTTGCENNPCVHGTCVAGGPNGFTCHCNHGYAGPTCNVQTDPCTPNPCKNSGQCVISNGEATCDCTSAYTGSRCETMRQSCGGVSRNPVGRLEFPIGGTTYQHGLSCAWVVITNHTLVLNVTFTKFDLEQSQDCKYDFLQIHDGRSAGGNMLGRFCGTSFPNNGTVVSSHNALYFWFHSDHSVAHHGFAFQWNTIEPVCGGTVQADYGTITSPGFPGRYPPNRDCFWTVHVRPGKKVQFLFGQLQLEQHPTCDNDYVEITEPEAEQSLARYCNHTHPAPLITPGPTAIVHFHSDSAGQDAGFQIHYTAIAASPDCGGTLTGASGRIRSPASAPSPTEEDRYQADMDCEWSIQMPPGERVKISWVNFEVEAYGERCSYDFVEVFDGPDTDSPLIGRYCGNSLPPTIKSNSNNVLVRFHTDRSIEWGGFTMFYELLCGGQFTETSGVITSPMYPNKYHASKTCEYEIVLPPSRTIELRVVDLDIEGRSPPFCFFDSLTIYDGDNENSTELGTLCGTRPPDDPYLSTHNYMFLRFTSDSSFQGRGFKANYTSVVRRCGGLYKEAPGTISSPTEDGYYKHDEECIWTIKAPPGHVIRLTWLSMHLENHQRCRNDYVAVYGNYSTPEAEPMGTYCGSRVPPVLTTQGPTMTIIFRTDSSVALEGFSVTYEFVDATRICGGHYVQPTGTIRSPNFPNEYPNDRECVWVIEVENKHKVTLTVNNFTLEAQSRCMFDYLEIRNGKLETSPLIGRYCDTIPTSLVSQSNSLYIKFKSDYSRKFTGFDISWDSTETGCGGTMNAVSGEIISPNYPQPYAANIDCTWTIAVSLGSVVRISIMDFDLEHQDRCRFDFLEIYEGSARRTDGDRYCNDDVPRIFQMTSNVVTVHFHSDFAHEGRGFHLRYDTLCHNKLSGFWGVIESPNFPNKYPHSANCSWTISAPVGNRINVTFSHFDVEQSMYSDCRDDYVEIKEGQEDTPNTELGRYCGEGQLPPRIHSTQEQVFVTFMTDSYVTRNGFRLEWAVDGCVGHMTRPFGGFTSPGYPRRYPHNVECEWLIEVDPTHSVELTLHDVYIEKRRGCVFDKLQLYGGQDNKAPLLLEICNSEKPVTYTSPGNKMFVRFYSDYSYADRGFNATYRSVPIRCGGVFTATSGVIHSANYPLNYPHSQNCEWLIRVDDHHVVNITFLDFDIEDSRNCTDDYVKIFDGPTRDAPLLGTHCRNQLPPSYVSTSNEMLVVMRTDVIIAAKGFKARYARACGARIIVKDNGYLQPTTSLTNLYEPVNCTWTLIAEDPADHVTVTFTFMDLEGGSVGNWWNCDDDYLQVIEGERIDGPVLGKWCDNKVPPSITSTGNALTVHLFLIDDLHANFVAAYSSLNTACGGTYKSEQGTIASPGYPNSYPLNSECVWVLQTSPGNWLSLTFADFDIQKSDNCDLDYLEIRENDGIGKLFSVSCGTEIESITTTSNIWMKFKSDDSVTAKGFKAEYRLLPGNELEGPMGEITSPLYPLTYHKAGTFNWRITVEFGFAVRIVLHSIHFDFTDDECYNSVQIYDGYNSDARLLAEECGLEDPEPKTSSGNVVFIVMSSLSASWGGSFRLTWLQVPRDTTSGNEVVNLSDCNEEIALMSTTNGSYVLDSPGWPNGYANNLECNWVFTSPPGTHLVMRVIAMNLEETSDCMADSVSVYSGNALTNPDDAVLQQRLCLSNSSHTAVKASNVMTVKFKSDSYVNKTGFHAYVYRECGGRLEGPNGVIEINNTTSVRGIRVWRYTCEWVVHVRPGRTIEVKIVEMDIVTAEDHTCGENNLMLRNGGEITSPLLGIGKYCGNDLPAPFETSGNLLYVKASGTVSHMRFKLTYREVSMNCGGDFVLSKDESLYEITSPNYPNIPPAHAECVWKVMAPAGERISIHFLERFDLTYSANCDREYVEIRDGGTESSRSMGRYCKDVAPSSMTTQGNMIYVHFYTDVPEPKNGFKAVITAGSVCGGVLRGTSGVINSPNYPLTYPKNQECVWAIIGPAHRSLRLQFRDIHLPSFRRCDRTDYVRIDVKSPGNDTEYAMTEVGRYCGNRIPDVIEVPYHEAYVTFQSDSRDFLSYRGFSLNFTATPDRCGGQLNALTGTIKSPGYPTPAESSRYCDWKITVPIGYHIVVHIEDLDAVSSTSRLGYSLSFYNDFGFKSRITSMGQVTTSQVIQSTSNSMFIGYYTSAGHRGFKLRYEAHASAPCGAALSERQGVITGPTVPPFNQTTYYCQWTLQPPDDMISADNTTGLTLTFKATGTIAVSESPIHNRNCSYLQYIAVAGIGTFCGNLTEPRYLRSPKRFNELAILNGTYAKTMNFHLEYEWQPCGGMLAGPRHVIESPKNISYPINCAWQVKYPDDGETIKLSFQRLNLGSCDAGYVIVRNGGPQSPDIGKFCGNIRPYNITSTSNQLWIEYYAAADPNDFKFTLEPASTGCGGALRGTSREISSPGFPHAYPNNSECTWEIMGDNGYHVGLAFVERFNLETSTNCSNDYIQVFQWASSQEIGGGTWMEMGKVCGRDKPRPFNATSNRMKVVFHSNEAKQGDGFRAVWSENCGGVFRVTREENIIQSPGYPNSYPHNLFCNYTLLAPDEDIFVEFLDFQVERGYGYCQYDNLSITTVDQWSDEETSVYCGNDKPPLRRSIGRVDMIFQTDKYVQRKGFEFKYHLNRCGGVLTKPGVIEPMTSDGQYFARSNCTWIIKAPAGKSVVLRFEKFILEYSTECHFDEVAIYEGEFINESNAKAHFCGNLTGYLPIVKSESNSMVVMFRTDNSVHYEGFSAVVLFSNSPAAGCGGVINLTSSHTHSFRTQRGSTYDSLEDCHWRVVTESGKNIKFTVSSMDLRNATNDTGLAQTNKCNGDFLEVYEGSGLTRELLGQYCGNAVPPPVVSSANAIWIRLYTDGTEQGAGVTATIEAVDSPCGVKVLYAQNTTQTFTSPGYPNTYGPGMNCRWIIRNDANYDRNLQIRFLDFDMDDTARCDEEYLQLKGMQNQEFLDHFGDTFISSGSRLHPSRSIMGYDEPNTVHKFCGTALPHDYYSTDEETELRFKTMTTGHKGFKLEYTSAVCDRNYTGEQGRIRHRGFRDCWYTITAPAGHTISLYFNRFSMYDYEQCTATGLEVFEGNFTGEKYGSYCGFGLPDPIFSRGNLLSIHSWSEDGRDYQNYDIIYTTTDKGRGCGGRIHNYEGVFTSPMYPNAYRNDTSCTWDVSVPRGSKIVLTFSMFDLGTSKNCAINYLKVFDAPENGEQSLRATYCGGDDPAKMEADGNRVIIQYVSSVNNAGSGWEISFSSEWRN